MTEQATTTVTEHPCPGQPQCPEVASHWHIGDQIALCDGWLVDLTAGRLAVELVPARARGPERRKRRR